MIIHGTYFGDKADVWSIGCILLELILGHEKFCDVWMASYDYEVLQDKASFTESIEDTLERLPNALRFSSGLNEFILKLLQLKSSKRPAIRSIATHAWLEGLMDAELAALRAAKLALSSNHTDPFSPQRSVSPNTEPKELKVTIQTVLDSFPRLTFIIFPLSSAQLGSSSSNHGEDSNQSSKVDTEVLKRAFQNLSEKERKQMEEYILRHRADAPDANVKHLPPIEPPTPNIGHARKLLHKDDSLLRKSQVFSPPSGEHVYNANTQPPTPMKGGSSHYLLSPIAPRQLQASTSRNQLPGLLEHQGSNNFDDIGGLVVEDSPNDGSTRINTTRSLQLGEEEKIMSPMVSSLSHSSIKIT